MILCSRNSFCLYSLLVVGNHICITIRGQNKPFFKQFKGHLGPIINKLRALIFFRTKFFSCVFYIRYEMSQLFQGPFGPLVLKFCGPSQNFEGNWPKGMPYFDPWQQWLNFFHVVHAWETLLLPTVCSQFSTKCLLCNACVKGHLEPTHLKSSPLFTFSKKLLGQDSPSVYLFSKTIGSRFTTTKIKLGEDSPSWLIHFRSRFTFK